MALTAEQQAELLTLSPADLVRKLAANHEILDRHDTNRTAAEERATAAEKKIAEEAEKARLTGLSEVEKERVRREAAESRATETGKALKDVTVSSAIKVAALGMGVPAEDVDDVVVLVRARGGDLDEKTAAEAVKALLEKKPHLARKGNGWVKEGEHAGTGAGARKAAPDAKQVTSDEWKTMTPAEKSKFSTNGGRVV
jgi:hypothetical protein